MVAFLPHSSWHNGQWDWEGGRRDIDMVRKHMHHWQEWKTTERCILLNIMSNLHYTINYSLLSTWEFGVCSPDSLGQSFIVKAGPHVTFQFHGKISEVLLCFWFQIQTSKIHSRAKKRTGENDQTKERGRDWSSFNPKLNILIKLAFLFIMIWIYLALL